MLNSKTLAKVKLEMDHFSWRRSYHIKASPLISSTNQWTGFCNESVSGDKKWLDGVSFSINLFSDPRLLSFKSWCIHKAFEKKEFYEETSHQTENTWKLSRT